MLVWCHRVFQHIVFAVKFLLAAFIPDVPADIKLAIKRVRVWHWQCLLVR